jgi:hypothetical protein
MHERPSTACGGEAANGVLSGGEVTRCRVYVRCTTLRPLTRRMRRPVTRALAQNSACQLHALAGRQSTLTLWLNGPLPKA